MCISQHHYSTSRKERGDMDLFVLEMGNRALVCEGMTDGFHTIKINTPHGTRWIEENDEVTRICSGSIPLGEISLKRAKVLKKEVGVCCRALFGCNAPKTTVSMA